MKDASVGVLAVAHRAVQWGDRLRLWLNVPRWLLLVGTASLAMLVAVLSYTEWTPTWPGWCAVLARGGIVALSVAPAQMIVRALREGLAFLFEVPGADEAAKNRRPQTFAGVLENVIYPLALFGLGPAGGTVIGAWITAKAAGSWKAWQTGEDVNSDDPHKGRRVMFVFLLCNAFQVLWAVLVTWVLGGIPRSA